MVRTVPFLAAALAASLLTACIHTRKTSVPPDGPRSIAYGYHTGIRAPTQKVIRTAEDWYRLWIDHHSNVVPVPLPPKVDFTREMVLCVAVGQRPTGGYGVRITRTYLEGGRLHVEAHETRPPQGAIVPMVLSQPYEMVRVPRFDGEVVFEMK
ncbi:MAG: protease complex subunit PrcB family protein [Planctomycetes bacterium]|nr:protease complex subunit PrcB family protein [Planctomycetota bacterium]